MKRDLCTYLELPLTLMYEWPHISRMLRRVSFSILLLLMGNVNVHASIVDISINQNMPLNTFQDFYGIKIYNYYQAAAIDPAGTELYATGVKMGATLGSFARIAGNSVSPTTSVGPDTNFLPASHFGREYLENIAQHIPTQIGPLEDVVWDEYSPPGGQLLFPALLVIDDGCHCYFPAQTPRYYGVLKMNITDGGKGTPFDVRIDGISYETSGGIYAPVPEPESYVLMLAGLGLMGAVVRRKKRQTSL